MNREDNNIWEEEKMSSITKDWTQEKETMAKDTMLRISSFGLGEKGEKVNQQ
jgi:hypothetical protein